MPEIGVGYVLVNSGKVIAYASKKHKIKERNHPTNDLYLIDIVFSLLILCHYIYGDHQSQESEVSINLEKK